MEPDLSLGQLRAIAQLGRSDIKKGKISQQTYGYSITKVGKNDPYVNAGEVKELVKKMPEFFNEGKLDTKFYENFQKGLNKLNFEHKDDHEAIKMVAQSLFDVSHGLTQERYNQLKRESPAPNRPNTQKEAANPQVAKDELSKLQASSLSRDSINIQQEGPVEEREKEEVEEILPREITPEMKRLQKEAARYLEKLIAPNFRKAALKKLQNLKMIETPQELDLFKKYIDILREAKRDAARNLQNDTLIPDAEKTKVYNAANVVHNQLILDKPHYQNSEGSALLRGFQDLFEDIYPQNLQTISDIYPMHYEPSHSTVMRREGNLNGAKRTVQAQEARSTKIPTDYSPDEIKLMKIGYIQRDTGFDMWEKSEWVEENTLTPKEPTSHPDQKIFVSGTIAFSYATPGREPVGDKISFDISRLGELNLAQNKAVMLYLKDAMFGARIPKSDSINFLNKEAKDFLIALGQAKRVEVELKQAKALMKIKNS